jgi:hypothetical protein
VSWEPPRVPKAMTQLAPALSWAVVGGHGKSAASVAAEPPPESVPVVGGPTVPVATVNGDERLPLASVSTMWLKGSEHDTGMALPAKLMVGWGLALLHSKMAPSELAVKPLPDTVTDWPLVSPVLGETERAAVAPAGPEKASIPSIPAPSRTAAPNENAVSLRKRRIRKLPPGLGPSPQPTPSPT